MAGRMYDPEIGRFISRDPLGYVDGQSLYNAYFAEKFALDPMGTYVVPGAPENKGYTPPGGKWNNAQFYSHFTHNGGAVTLTQTGWNADIWADIKKKGILRRFGMQIEKKAIALCKANGPGIHDLTVTFNNGYNFINVLFTFGKANVSGDFSTPLYCGLCDYEYTGMADIAFYDYYHDPYNIVNAPISPINWGGTPYEITDEWLQEYSGFGSYDQ